MNAKRQEDTAEFYSTMLIAKLQRQANSILRKKLQLTLKHPTLSELPLAVVDLLSALVAILGGLLLGGIVFFLSSFLFSVIILDSLLTLIFLILGIWFSNREFNKWMNHPSGTVHELNTFFVCHKTFPLAAMDTSEKRQALEEKLRKIHRLYKRSVLKRLKNNVKHDFELTTSKKVLLTAADELGQRSLLQPPLDQVHEWAYKQLDAINKGTRLFFWSNVQTNHTSKKQNLIVLSEANLQKSILSLNVPIDELVDELTLLMFAKRYASIMVPLLKESMLLINEFDTRFTKFHEQTKTNSKQSEPYAEVYRVLLSKVLGMQEVLKSTQRQLQRMFDARNDLATEARLKNSPELELLTDQFVSGEDFHSFLDSTSSLKKQLSIVARDLRTLDFTNISRGSFENLEYITNTYLSLEKLRLVTDWFEDIASYTTLAGGVGIETGTILKKYADHLTGDIVLHADDLFKTYHTLGSTIYALRGVSLSIKRGEFVVITGASGSGKTTLLNLLAGLDKPDRGAVYIDKINLLTLNDNKLTELRRDKIGFIFQFYNLLPVLNNQENVSFPAEIGNNGRDITTRALASLNNVELSMKAKQFPNKLSGGQMQRVTIARSLINNPSILMADEPTGDLDSITGKQVMDLISNFHKKGTTVVLVTHDKGLLHYADRIITMKDGKIETA